MKRKITKREVYKTQRKTSDTQWNCSPPSDQCPSSNLPSSANSASLSMEYYVLWYGISFWLVQVLAMLPPISACAPAHWQGMGNLTFG